MVAKQDCLTQNCLPPAWALKYNPFWSDRMKINSLFWFQALYLVRITDVQYVCHSKLSERRLDRINTTATATPILFKCHPSANPFVLFAYVYPHQCEWIYRQVFNLQASHVPYHLTVKLMPTNVHRSHEISWKSAQCWLELLHRLVLVT